MEPVLEEINSGGKRRRKCRFTVECLLLEVDIFICRGGFWGRWMGGGLEKLLFSCLGKFVFPSWSTVFPRMEISQDRVIEFFLIALEWGRYAPAYSCSIRIAVGSRELRGVAEKVTRGLRTFVRSPCILSMGVGAPR